MFIHQGNLVCVSTCKIKITQQILTKSLRLGRINSVSRPQDAEHSSPLCKLSLFDMCSGSRSTGKTITKESSQSTSGKQLFLKETKFPVHVPHHRIEVTCKGDTSAGAPPLGLSLDHSKREMLGRSCGRARGGHYDYRVT